MKRVQVFLMLALLCVFSTGCDAAVTGKDMQNLAQQIQTVNQGADKMQEATRLMQEFLQQQGVIDPNTVVKIDKINSEIDAVQPKIAEITKAVAAAPYEETDDTVTVILKTGQAVNSASSPWNPYAALIAVALTLASGLYGTWQASQRKKAEAAKAELQRQAAEAEAAFESIESAYREADAKYQAHKQGVELTMKEADADPNATTKTIAAALYKNIGQARNQLGVTA